MNDELLNKMSQDIGILIGKVDTIHKTQNDINVVIFQKVDEHDTRISSIETDRTRVITIAGVVTFCGAAISGFIGWFNK